MRPIKTLGSFAVVLLSVARMASGTDLSSVSRKLVKEPAYTLTPKYCLLVFGPEAEARVWLVLDGKTLYVDRNGDGDLTAPDERITPDRAEGSEVLFKTGNVTVSADGKKQASLSIERFGQLTQIAAEFDATHKQVAGSDPDGNLEFSDTPATAPVVHFGGPLTLTTNGDGLHRGKSYPLYAMVGTPGIGAGTFASLQYTCMPGKARAVADVETREKDKPASVTQRVVLEQRC